MPGRALGPVAADDRLGALAATYSCIAAISASVSETKWLIATTAGTPNCFTFSMCRPRLAQPFFTAATFSVAEVVLGDAAVHLQRAHGRDDHRRGRLQAGLAALDVEELLGAEVGAEAGLGHHVVGELQRRRRRQHRVAAVGDVGERAAVHEGRVVLERLHQVRLHRVPEQHRHRAVGLEVAGVDRRAVAAVGDDDVAEPLLEVVAGRWRGRGSPSPRRRR